MDILLLIKIVEIINTILLLSLIVVITLGFISLKLKQKNKAKLELTQSIIKLFTIVSFICVVLLHTIGPILNKKIAEKFYSLNTQNKMLIQYARTTFEIKDQTAISEFIGIIKKSDAVDAHHSQPINIINFSFPEIGYFYALGQDSKYNNVFWLEWHCNPVKRFYSEKLNSWLKKNTGMVIPNETHKQQYQPVRHYNNAA
jgi:hypothetical protein